jgi:hypothetical protein
MSNQTLVNDLLAAEARYAEMRTREHELKEYARLKAEGLSLYLSRETIVNDVVAQMYVVRAAQRALEASQ